MFDPPGAPAEPIADTPLARFLVGAPAEPPSLESTRYATLSGVMLERAPDHADRDALRRDAFLTAARHLAVKAELVRLFRAWNEAGVAPLIIKGFYLSEFIYPSTSLRIYNDVDLYLPPQQVGPACDAASACGWNIVWRCDEADHPRAWRAAGYHGHEAAQLRHPGLGLGIDVHRRLAHNSHERVPRFRVQARLTEAAVKAACDAEWCDVHIRLPNPADAVVFGLALNRCWSSDAWNVKPRDYCDLDALRARHALARATILQRAEELGVRRTVEIYLSRCDPYRRRLFLGSPGWRTWWWNLVVTTERGPHDLNRRATKARLSIARDVRGAWALVRTWSLVEQALRFARIGSPVEEWVARYPVARHQRQIGQYAWRALLRAVHRHHRLRRVNLDERRTVAVLVAFAWLRSRGHAASVAVDGGDPGSLTLLLDGSPLEATTPTHDVEA